MENWTSLVGDPTLTSEARNGSTITAAPDARVPPAFVAPLSEQFMRCEHPYFLASVLVSVRLFVTVSTNLDRTGYLNRKQLHQAVLGLCFKLFVKLRPSEISARTEASETSERVTFQGFCEWILDTFPEICQSDPDTPAKIDRARSTIH